MPGNAAHRQDVWIPKQELINKNYDQLVVSSRRVMIQNAPPKVGSIFSVLLLCCGYSSRFHRRFHSVLQCLYKDLRREFRAHEKDILGACYDARTRTIFVDLKSSDSVETFIKAFHLSGFQHSPYPENKLVVSLAVFRE